MSIRFGDEQPKVVRRVRKFTEDVSMADGTYAGVKGGYIVTFTIDGAEYEAETIVGVRGIDIPCEVVVEGNAIVSIS